MNLGLPFVPPYDPSGSADSVAIPDLGGTSVMNYKVQFGKKHRHGHPPGAEDKAKESYEMLRSTFIRK